jgi:GT2 family glycosyltransferase
MDRLDVTVIIVSWNTRDILRDCLRSVCDQTRAGSFEVIVVDNASSDGSAAMVRSEFPAVALVENRENRGFAAANNQALARASGRYVLLLNPDTLILDRAIDTMVGWMDAHPRIGCAGCQVLEDRDTVQMTCFRFPSPLNILLSLTGLDRLFPRSRLFGRYWMRWWDRRSEREVDVVSGMFMLVRREVLAQIGPMDEDYFIYAEEADWCYRMRRAGWSRVFTPAARIVHREGGGKSTAQLSTKMYVQQQKSLLIFHRKNLGFLAWAAAKLFYTVSMLARMVAWKLNALLRRGGSPELTAARAAAALRYHLTGVEPRS